MESGISANLGRVNLEIWILESWGLSIWKSGSWKPGACKHVSISRGQSEHHEHQSVSGLAPIAKPPVPWVGACTNMSISRGQSEHHEHQPATYTLYNSPGIPYIYPIEYHLEYPLEYLIEDRLYMISTVYLMYAV